ncbi:MAG TPA: hypothetical protein VLI39_04980 [Sedimentisphaerales bacterium]|nr:hypothetical protein [Sedimentisphaerales bacterium]
MSESANRPAFGAGCSQIITIGHDRNIKEAAAKMLSHNVGCLIVLDDHDKFGSSGFCVLFMVGYATSS